MINSLFYNLSTKYRRENDLSDFTWAMCEACESFRNAFLRFFFSDIDISSTNLTIEREKSENDSRPDFVIYCNDETYIIENKIYDTNHHFGQYDKTFNIVPQRFGYITNYSITDEEIHSKGYSLRTWEQLYDTFMNNLPENEDDKNMWIGFLGYLKSVCDIIKIDAPMRLNGIYSLYSLMLLFEKLSDRREQDFELYFKSRNYICGANSYLLGVTGVNFDFKYRSNPDVILSGWIGIYYDRPEPLIDIEFRNHPGWGGGYCDMILPFKSNWKNQSTFIKPYFEESDGNKYLCFELTKELHEKFNKSDDVAEQEVILKAFMNEVLNYPITLNQE